MEMKALNPSWFVRLQSRIARAERAALADESDIAGSASGCAKVAFKPMMRQHHADAVWSNDPHRAARVGDLLFQLAPAFADLLEAGGNDDRAFHSGRDAIAHDLRHGRCLGGDDGEINRGRHVADLRERPLTKNGGVCGIYRKEPFA